MKAGDYEIRCNEDGSLDEIVACKPEFFHLEQMDDGHWWLRIDLPGVMGGGVAVDLFTKRGRILATYDEE